MKHLCMDTEASETEIKMYNINVVKVVGCWDCVCASAWMRCISVARLHIFEPVLTRIVRFCFLSERARDSCTWCGHILYTNVLIIVGRTLCNIFNRYVHIHMDLFRSSSLFLAFIERQCKVWHTNIWNPCRAFSEHTHNHNHKCRWSTRVYENELYNPCP